MTTNSLTQDVVWTDVASPFWAEQHAEVGEMERRDAENGDGAGKGCIVFFGGQEELQRDVLKDNWDNILITLKCSFWDFTNCLLEH